MEGKKPKAKYKAVQLEKQYGDLHLLIPPMVNMHGQAFVAQSLGVSQYFISNWLKQNGYVMGITYIRITDKAKEALETLGTVQA